jgi:hypothetical protein
LEFVWEATCSWKFILFLIFLLFNIFLFIQSIYNFQKVTERILKNIKKTKTEKKTTLSTLFWFGGNWQLVDIRAHHFQIAVSWVHFTELKTGMLTFSFTFKCLSLSLIWTKVY